MAIASVAVTTAATSTAPAVATLTSASFDPDGGTLASQKWEVVTEAYSWLSLATPTAVTTTFTVPTPTLAARYGQSIEFRLTVTDEDTPAATASTTVTFNINQGPTADIAVSAMLADPASPDVRGYDDDGDGVKDENDEKYPLDGVIDGPGENGNADNEWDIVEGALITLDGSGSSDPGGTLAAAAHDWTRVYITTPVTGYANDPTASLPDSTDDVKMISTDEDAKVDPEDRSTEVMTPLVAAGTGRTGRLAAPFYVYYRLTVTDSSSATNTKIVKLVIHDRPADPVIDSIVPMANTDAATGAAGSKISCQMGATGTACETGAPGSGRYVIAPRSAITLTPTVSPARQARNLTNPVWDADGDTPTVTWEGATDTDPAAPAAAARFTAPASAEDGDEFTVTATATDVTGRTSSKSVTLVVAANTAPDAVAPGTLAPTQLFSSIVVNDGPDGGDIDPLTKRGTGTVKLRGIGHDPDGGTLIHAWTELALATNTDGDQVLPDLDTSTTPPSLNRATSVRPIRLPAKPLVTIDGAFSQDASFQVPEVSAKHTKIDITEAAIGVDLNGDGNATGTDDVSVVAVPIAYTVLDEFQVKTTKIVIVFIRDTDDVPRANAGRNQQVTPGSFVRLNGGASSDADPGDRLKWEWTYVGIETDPKTEDRSAITAAERGYGFVEGKWFPYDGKIDILTGDTPDTGAGGAVVGDDATDDDGGLGRQPGQGRLPPDRGRGAEERGNRVPVLRRAAHRRLQQHQADVRAGRHRRAGHHSHHRRRQRVAAEEGDHHHHRRVLLRAGSWAGLLFVPQPGRSPHLRVRQRS